MTMDTEQYGEFELRALPDKRFVISLNDTAENRTALILERSELAILEGFIEDMAKWKDSMNRFRCDTCQKWLIRRSYNGTLIIKTCPTGLLI